MSSTDDLITMDLKYRQICATLIQDLGLMHNVSQLLINTAIVYMHKLYEKFSYTELKPVYVAMTSFYLASKSEDCARKLNDIVKTMYQLSGKQIDSNFERIVSAVHALESIMLMSVGFPRLDFGHPHIVIIDIVKKYDIHRGFAETAYFICTSMLHLTTLCVRYNTQEIAAAALYVASKWDYVELKDINLRPWFSSISPNLSISVLQKISREFLDIYVRTPIKLKLKAFNFLRRFHNKGEPQSVNSTTSIPRSLHKPIAENVTVESEKLEPLEEGEIDQSSDEKVRNENLHQNRKLSLHQYYQRKDVPETSHKPSPVNRNNDFPKSYSQSSNNSIDKKRRHEHSVGSNSINKYTKTETRIDPNNGKESYYQNRQEKGGTPNDYYMF